MAFGQMIMQLVRIRHLSCWILVVALALVCLLPSNEALSLVSNNNPHCSTIIRSSPTTTSMMSHHHGSFGQQRQRQRGWWSSNDTNDPELRTVSQTRLAASSSSSPPSNNASSRRQTNSSQQASSSSRITTTPSNKSQPPPPKTQQTTKSQQIKQKSRIHGTDPLLSLNINLDSLAKSSNQPESARQAEELLLRIERLYEDGYYESRPDTVSYNSVMNGYARLLEGGDGVGVEDGLESVMRILKRMEDLSTVTPADYNDDTTDDEAAGTDPTGGGSAEGNKKNRFVRPTIVTWNTVMRSLAKHGYGTKAEELLNHVEELYQNQTGYNCDAVSPNTITYNSCIDAYAKAKQPQNAERILRQMMMISSMDDGRREEEIKADAVSFNTVLHAWAVSRKKGGAQRAQQLLGHMEKLYYAGNVDVKPDVFSYTAVMSAWATTSNYNRNAVGSSGGGDGDEGEDATDKAMVLLHKMEQSCALGDDNICPNTVTYTVVINILARSGKTGSALNAHDILLQMENQYRQSGTGNAGKLNEKLKPDRICYTSVIDAYARCEEEYAGEKAVELLNHMILLSEELGHVEVRPDKKTYCSVISALGKSRARGAADMAQRILNDMEELYYACGNDDVAPNTIVFNAVIDAWSRSSFIYKADRAYALLRRMEDTQSATSPLPIARGGEHPTLCLKPDVITYNSVISAAANSFGDARIKAKALRIATDAYRKVQMAKDLQPTSQTYALFAKAIRKLIADERQRCAFNSKILHTCCRDGLMSKYTLSQLQMSFTSRKQFMDLLESKGYSSTNKGPVSMKSIPDEWKRHSERRR